MGSLPIGPGTVRAGGHASSTELFASCGETHEGDEEDEEGDEDGEVVGRGAVGPRNRNPMARVRGAKPLYIISNIIFDDWSLSLFLFFC